MSTLEKGEAITWVFWILTLMVFLFQFYSWIFYKQQIAVITELRDALMKKPNKEIDQLLLELSLDSKSPPLSTHVHTIIESSRYSRAISISEFSALTEEDDAHRLFNVIPNTAIALFLIAGLAGTIFLLKGLLLDADLGRIVNAGGDIMTTELKESISNLSSG